MNRIWNSVVGKLWLTILLLVSFVLFIATVLQLEFLENYHSEQIRESLNQEAETIAQLFREHEGESMAFEVIPNILDEDTNVMVAQQPDEVTYYIHEGLNSERTQNLILEEPAFQKVFETDQTVVREMILPSLQDANMLESFIVLASPLEAEEAVHGTVFIYQSLDVMQQTTRETTNTVFLSAFIAFILTTIFAFFLSTRITSPLRKIREGAMELAKGNFDTKVRATSNDEIGQLAVAFNQMGRQLKHHLEVISQEKEQLSSILTSMTDAVITFNQDRTILVSNPPADQLIREWFYSHGAEDEFPMPSEMLHMLDYVLEQEEELDEELEMEGVYYAITISPLYSGDSVRGAVAVLRNMTEQHRLEKLRSDFIANVSHELRTPVQMLQGYSEAIMDDVVETEEERREVTKIIYEESHRMGRLVSDLLDLARLESGHMRLYRNPVAIKPAIERMTMKFAQAAREQEIKLSFKSSLNDQVIVEIDEDRIEQVMTNLIDNAIRHTPRGGEVTVNVTGVQGFAKVAITDNGIGITAEDLEYVFERFYKADKARTRGKGGTGLGLAIARNIIMAHEGKISAESTLGEGTVFSFILPLKKL